MKTFPVQWSHTPNTPQELSTADVSQQATEVQWTQSSTPQEISTPGPAVALQASEVQWDHSPTALLDISSTDPAVALQVSEVEPTPISDLVAHPTSHVEYPIDFEVEEKKQDDHDLDSSGGNLKTADHDAVGLLTAALKPDIGDPQVSCVGSTVPEGTMHNVPLPNESQVEPTTVEKNQEDHDQEPPSGVNPPVDGSRGPTSEVSPKADPEAESSAVKSISASGNQPSAETSVLDVAPLSEEKSGGENTSSAETGEQSSCHDVILSLSDDYYKSTMWKYYRILGKDKDTDRKNQIGNEVLSLLKQRLGTSGKFFKRMGNEDFEVDSKVALASECTFYCATILTCLI